MPPSPNTASIWYTPSCVPAVSGRRSGWPSMLHSSEFIGLSVFHSLITPLQRAFSERFAQIDITLRIRGDAVDMEDLRGPVPAVAAEISHHLERVPLQNLNLLVGPVWDVDELLSRVGREGEIEGGAF